MNWVSAQILDLTNSVMFLMKNETGRFLEVTYDIIVTPTHTPTSLCKIKISFFVTISHQNCYGNQVVSIIKKCM